MCGLGGILRRDGGTVPDAWIETIDARIAHRGPDGAGVFRDRVEAPGEPPIEVVLVHRRLAVIDPDGGHQPMVRTFGRSGTPGAGAEDELVAVVFNGCIYNHRALRRELERAGHRFESDHADTEVLVHAYRAWGPGFEQRLDGMFAFALWDRAARRLVLARDRFGEKPLYTRWNPGESERTVAFCSDARALALLDRAGGAAAGEDEAERLQWLATFLQVGHDWRGGTVHPDVRAVPPTIQADIDDLVPERPRDELDVQTVERLLAESVEQRLESDVPLGCFLSGGVDSSLVAAMASRVRPDLDTFTVRMPDDRYDESDWAARVAGHLGLRHHVLDAGARPAEDLQMLIERLGQPFADSSILPTYWVSRAARSAVTVALSGDGADEHFLGYERHVRARALNRHRRVLRLIPPALARGRDPKDRLHRLARAGAMAREMPRTGVLALKSPFTLVRLRALLGPSCWDPAVEPIGPDPMMSLRRSDLADSLPADLLLKVDTASMAVALEVRSPFLGRAISDAALRAPSWSLLPDGRRKGLLRALARTLLPAEAVDRPKMGFAIPIGSWFGEDGGGLGTMLRDHLHAADPFGPLPIDATEARRLAEEHWSGRLDHGQRLFALLTLSIWSRLG